jgi:SAM-dependent methyltransferase
MTNHARDVERYYDFIYLWTQLTNRFRAFRAVQPYVIHRALIDEATGEFRTSTIHDIITDAIRGQGDIDALDAGCGYGGTMMELHKSLGGRWRGITINRHQVRIARRNAKLTGLEGALTFELSSYDDPLPQTFNVIYGIESLIHSTDPGHTIANLADALQPGGLLIVIDDMPIEAVPPAYAPDLEAFKAGWRCPIAPSARGWVGHLTRAHLTIVSNRDHTPLMRPRSEPEILEALAELDRGRRWRDRIGLRLVAEAQHGGLMLERLTRERIVEHRMIVARKPDATRFVVP